MPAGPCCRPARVQQSLPVCLAALSPAAAAAHLQDPAAILPARIERRLFAVLDGESDSASSAQLKAILATLLGAGAGQEPGYWLSVCGEPCTLHVWEGRFQTGVWHTKVSGQAHHGTACW